MIEISHLHKFFNKGKANELHVINDVTLSLPEKGIVAIFGRSGCGKTTLLNVIGGLDSYRSGSLTVFGQTVGEDPDRCRNRDIGYIFQNYNLLKTETCYENVASALYLCGMQEKEEIARRVETALSFVDMAEYANRSPETLSGGQQQRVAIARAIVKNPRIVLADEPTGNLDEINTVKVMELLREIARDCLVILVTHEEELVDHYCDRVIELSDGKVVSVRENRISGGYAVRDKNAVYLGELEKDTLTGDAVSVSYYGEKPDSPIALKVVRYGGKTYLSVDTEGILLLDKDSETKLYDGVFEAKPTEALKTHVDMSRLPRVSGAHYGSLFSAKRAIVSGYRANFQKGKKGKNLLRGCLAIFAAVVVLMTAIFGTVIGDVIDMKNTFNSHVFYASERDYADYLKDPAVLEKNGIDALYAARLYYQGDSAIEFNTGFFETFSNSYLTGNFSTNGVFLSNEMTDGLSLLAGSKTLTNKTDILISSRSADLLLKESSFGYLKTYDDLIGLTAKYTDFEFGNDPLRIVGVVDCDETAFYLSPMTLARYVFGQRNLYVAPATGIGIEVEKGETVYAVLPERYENDPQVSALKVGEEILMLGQSMTLQKIRTVNETALSGYGAEGLFVVDDETYIALLTSFGESHPLVSPFAENEEKLGNIYYVIHADDPEKADAFLEKKRQEEADRHVSLVTPNDQFEEALHDEKMTIVTGIVTMAVILGVMSVCMYLIMRSTLMNRIREIGIYRAIGVSKQNLVFRFAVETAVLVALTVLIGYLLMSAFVALCLSASAMVASVFFYPFWLALIVLLVLVLLSMICGLIPILLLLRKTPSAILAQFDI